MQNKDKFDNFDDAFEVYKKMCKSQNKCEKCTYSTDGVPYYCIAKWLYDEAKDESEKENNDDCEDDEWYWRVEYPLGLEALGIEDANEENGNGK